MSEALLASIVSWPFWYVTTAWPAATFGSAAAGLLGALSFICSGICGSCALLSAGRQSNPATARTNPNCRRLDNILGPPLPCAYGLRLVFDRHQLDLQNKHGVRPDSGELLLSVAELRRGGKLPVC